ncbi:MAG: AAA family ATPase [Psychrobium sp.]
MVDTPINRQGSMDVVLDVQEQLISRIALAMKDSNKLSFLHGPTGVGKSHIANRLQNLLSATTFTIKLSPKSALEPEQLKQQLVCELATDELTDLNQPIATAVLQAVNHHHQSIVVLIDNAELVANQGLSAIWQALHEFSRANQTAFTFNVLLIGDSKWAKPFHHGLKSKSDSRVAEFLVNTLSKKQAVDFMMRVHADWSDQKIQQFVNKVPEQYLIPKQLIYAQLPQRSSAGVKAILWLSVLVAVILAASVGIAYYLQSTTEESVTTDIPGVIATSPIETAIVVNPPKETIKADDEDMLAQGEGITEAVLNDDDEALDDISIKEFETAVIEQPAKSVEEDSLNPVLASPQSEVADIEQDIQQTPAEEQAPVEEVIEVSTTKVTADNVVTAYNFDEEYLMAVDAKKFALMLGGFGQRQSLQRVQTQLATTDDLKVYQTIRDNKPWYVLLYGDFETRAAANEFVTNNRQQFVGITPWAKPFQSIQSEIIKNTRQLENNDNDSN